MPSVHLCLGWVVEVLPYELAASFETYVDLLPTFNALRLCHLYGGNRPLSRLPVELIDAIRHCLLVEQRKPRMEEHRIAHRCLKEICEPRDHFNEDEILDRWSTMLGVWAEEDAIWECYEANQARRETGKLQLDGEALELFNKYLAEESHQRHDDRLTTYLDQIGNPAMPRQENLFATHRGVLERHFGLSVWLSQIHPPTPPRVPRRAKAWDDGDMRIFLILPTDFSESMSWDHGGFTAVDTGFALAPPPPPPQQTDPSLQRFSRALSTLCLQAGTTIDESHVQSVTPELKLMVRHRHL